MAQTSNKAPSPEGFEGSYIARRTRSARSASAELGDDNIAKMGRASNRNIRGTSVESSESHKSEASIGNDRSDRRSKASRVVATIQDLATVEEDTEATGSESDAPADLSNDDDEVPQRRSPGGESAVSGSSTFVTSQSANEIPHLDPLLAEILPSLLDSSTAILELLAPPNATETTVETIHKDLKTIGSKRARLLKLREQIFDLTRSHYGGDWYIKPEYTLRALLATSLPGDWDFRPDVVLHMANLAIAMKEVLVLSRHSSRTTEFLNHLSNSFPAVFVSDFSRSRRLGGSSLFEEAFRLTIEIRTQLAIAYLIDFKDDEEKNTAPHVTLASVFYDDLPDPSNDEYFENLFQNSQPRRLMGVEPTALGDRMTDIQKRILLIRSAFRNSGDAADAGDLVDFDLLEQQFPWRSFLAMLMQWSRLRLDEIAQSIKERGGIQNMMKALVNAIKDVDSQADLSYDPSPFQIEPARLLPAAEIVPPSSGQSFYNGKGAVHMLQRLKRGELIQNATPAPSDQARTTNPIPPSLPIVDLRLSQQGQKRTYQQSNASLRDNQLDGLDLNEDMAELRSRPPSEYLSYLNDHLIDKNKENHLILGQSNSNYKKPSLLDRQAGAHKIGWEGLSQEQTAPVRKRPKGKTAASDETVFFQQDPRLPNPARRAEAKAAVHRKQIEREPSGVKRAKPPSPRLAVPAGSPSETRNRTAPTTHVNNARPSHAHHTPRSDDDDDEAQDEMPSHTQVSMVARTVTAQARYKPRPMQRRVAWSESDSDQLISLIEQYGCNWSFLEKSGDWDHPRNQVALKDRARNMKVNYLKSGIPLPMNFEYVTVGRKEKDAVLSVRPGCEFEEREDF